ncbi:MAG: hypothetical protein JWN41_707 [Thermoleophilia bacterium]|nr:hypothetical protein [Thermoleophilia bacterium]
MGHETDAELSPTCHETGQTTVEYAAVLAVITIAILLTLQLIGDSAGGLINKVVNFLM